MKIISTMPIVNMCSLEDFFLCLFALGFIFSLFYIFYLYDEKKKVEIENSYLKGLLNNER